MESQKLNKIAEHSTELRLEMQGTVIICANTGPLFV